LALAQGHPRVGDMRGRGLDADGDGIAHLARFARDRYQRARAGLLDAPSGAGNR
jgi:hypothetical protein